MILLTIAGALIGWNLQSPAVMIAALIVNLILSLIIIFKPHTAPYLSQAYAVIEGVLLKPGPTRF